MTQDLNKCVDTNILLQTKNQHLTQKNKTLKEQNLIMKSQLDELNSLLPIIKEQKG
jgi:hypothetical protein